jgi:hypothetical protein
LLQIGVGDEGMGEPQQGPQELWQNWPPAYISSCKK